MFCGRGRGGRSIHRLMTVGIGSRTGYSAKRMPSSALIATISVASSAVVISTSDESLLKGNQGKICSCEGGDAKIQKSRGGRLFNIDSTYYLMEELGEGAYGTVFKALRKSDNAVS